MNDVLLAKYCSDKKYLQNHEEEAREFFKKHIKQIIDMGRDQDRGDSYLMCALMHRNKLLVEILLDNNFPTQTVNNFTETPLLLAIKYKWKDIIDRIIETKPKPYKRKMKRTELTMLFEKFYGDDYFKKTAKKLVELGHPVELTDKMNNNILSLAIKKNDLDLVKFIVEDLHFDIKVNPELETNPLVYSINFPSDEIDDIRAYLANRVDSVFIPRTNLLDLSLINHEMVPFKIFLTKKDVKAGLEDYDFIDSFSIMYDEKELQPFLNAMYEILGYEMIFSIPTLMKFIEDHPELYPKEIRDLLMI